MMRLSFSQEMRQVQKQILAPRMIQSMEILQLPLMALQERIEQELQENEMLEMREDDPDLPDEPRDAEDPDQPTTEEKELVISETGNNAEDFERLETLDRDFPEDYYEERPRTSSGRIDEASDRQHDAMANMLARPQTLHEYLCAQLGYSEIDPSLRTMAERIIYNLDHHGRLPGRLEDLLDAQADDEERALARAALAQIQKLDPPGVGARDLRECLLLQLRPGMPWYEDLQTLISKHLEDLEKNRLPQIAKRANWTLEHVQTLIEELRKLNPRPGADFDQESAAMVAPDIFVELGDDGVYRVRLEDRDLPPLRLSRYYRKLLETGTADANTREYIKRKMTSAQWLIESIEQRRNTLQRVAQAVVEHQQRFFADGPEAIEPLKMQQIADKVGVHVTTVSRAVDGKWMQAPRGIFPLRRFFVGGTTASDGEEVAWDTIRIKLHEIIDREDKTAPLSDDDLVVELGRQGLTLARRTVTKYRKAMKIPSSRERKDWTLAAKAADPQ